MSNMTRWVASICALAAGAWSWSMLGSVGPGATALTAQAPTARPADLVLTNGRIVTVEEQQPEVQALAVNGDTIAALGTNAEIQRYVGPNTRVIDLKGALATPGLMEGHAHFTGVGDAARNLKLATANTWRTSSEWLVTPRGMRALDSGLLAAAGTRRNGRPCRRRMSRVFRFTTRSAVSRRTTRSG